MNTSFRLLPESASSDAYRLVAARMMRAFADGLVSVLLPVYLTRLGFSTTEVGALVTATLLGSAGFTLVLGLYAHRLTAQRLLLVACALMVATGFGFAWVRDLPWLLLIAFIGTINPSAGDVTVFLPLEQSLLARSVAAADLATLYARSNVAASGLGALGALASAYPEALALWFHVDAEAAMRLAFFFYSVVALLAAFVYVGLDAPVAHEQAHDRAPLRESRRVVLKLSALFTLDSFGGGFVVQSLLALWFFQRFHFTLSDAAGFFFATSILSAVSQLGSPKLAKRFGLVPTMVFTHIPANAFLVAAAFMESPAFAIACLLMRMAFASMDVPARQAFVMRVVPEQERAAAAALTNVPRSLGAGLAPVIAGALLARSDFGYPLVIGGCLKIAYDLLLLSSFRHHAASRPL